MCATMPNVVIVGQADLLAIYRFFNMTASIILDLLCTCLDHPQRAFDGLYHYAKFCWNRCSSFDKMEVLDFSSLA